MHACMHASPARTPQRASPTETSSRQLRESSLLAGSLSLGRNPLLHRASGSILYLQRSHPALHWPARRQNTPCRRPAHSRPLRLHIATQYRVDPRLVTPALLLEKGDDVIVQPHVHARFRRRHYHPGPRPVEFSLVGIRLRLDPLVPLPAAGAPSPSGPHPSGGSAPPAKCA